MELVRFQQGDVISAGELDGAGIWPLVGDLMHLVRRADAVPIAVDRVRLLAPVVPSKVIAVGPNYHAHLKGGKPPSRPYLWVKPSTTICGPGACVALPNRDIPVNHESELAIVIGRRARHVARADALDYVLGYTCINDISMGDMSDPGRYLASQELVDGKIYDDFAPIGPWVQTRLNTETLRITCRVNGEIRQDHSTSDMIWRPAELVSMISQVMTLLPGDIIATGSPPGVGPMHKGDAVEIHVEGIGALHHTVAT